MMGHRIDLAIGTVSLRVREWIEIITLFKSIPETLVSLRVREWIEIERETVGLLQGYVSLRVREWIEILLVMGFTGAKARLPPCEGVD